MEDKKLIFLSLAVMKKKGLFTELPDGSATFDKRDLKKFINKFKELEKNNGR